MNYKHTPPSQQTIPEGIEVHVEPSEPHRNSTRSTKLTKSWNNSGRQTSEEAEVTRETKKKVEENEAKLKGLVKNSYHVLFRCKAVFPFDLFPDELSIEPTQINICKNMFFYTSRANSIPVKNVADAIVVTVPFFANLKIVDQNFVENSVDISFLKRSDAEKARRIIQGLIVASKEGVDLAKISPDELKKRLGDLGKMQRVTAN